MTLLLYLTHAQVDRNRHLLQFEQVASSYDVDRQLIVPQPLEAILPNFHALNNKQVSRTAFRPHAREAHTTRPRSIAPSLQPRLRWDLSIEQQTAQSHQIAQPDRSTQSDRHARTQLLGTDHLHEAC